MHRGDGGRASVWRVQYVRDRLKSRRPGLSAAVYPGKIGGGKNRRCRTGRGRYDDERRGIALVAERISGPRRGPRCVFWPLAGGSHYHPKGTKVAGGEGSVKSCGKAGII